MSVERTGGREVYEATWWDGDLEREATVAADGTLLELEVEVREADVPEPVALRYAWADNPVVNLYSSAWLPVTPFRSDDWPGVTTDQR